MPLSDRSPSTAGGLEDGTTSIVVVAADSGPLLRTCIASALASTSAVEVWLVDNASSDGEVDAVAAIHAADSRLHVLRHRTNLGYGPACNRGAALSSGDLLMFLNPDCELPAATIAHLRSALAADSSIGLLGVTVCAPDGEPARGNRRRDPTLQRAGASMTGLARLESRWPFFAGVEMPATGILSGVEYIEAVSGACVAIPRSLFDALGGFDEAYFLHVEDLDLCRRVRDRGRRVAIVNGLKVRHVQGSSSRRRPVFVAWHKHRGMWRYFRKFDPAARSLLLSCAAGLGICAHFVALLPIQVLAGRRARRG